MNIKWNLINLAGVAYTLFACVFKEGMNLIRQQLLQKVQLFHSILLEAMQIHCIRMVC